MLNRSLLIASVMAMTMIPEQRIKPAGGRSNGPQPTPARDAGMDAAVIAKAEAKRARNVAKRIADMTTKHQGREQLRRLEK